MPRGHISDLSIVNQRLRSWSAALFAVGSLLALPLVSTDQSTVYNADACASAGGRHVSVGGCADLADTVADYVPPPASYAPMPEDTTDDTTTSPPPPLRRRRT